ncbi:hypothetical protein QFI66_011780 [Raoultella sp. BAC10a-01-01]|uniref:Uncharacterized protein n=1 Tax=Raoultella scottii TaxID=3040937 RepID=A0ABU8Z5N0_9ENTR
MNLSRRTLLASAIGSFFSPVFAGQKITISDSDENAYISRVNSLSESIDDVYKTSVSGTDSSILTYLSESKINSLTILGSEVDITEELKTIIDKKITKVYLPPQNGIYVLSGNSITLPAGFSIFGDSKKIYNVKSTASFNNAGTVLRLSNNADCLFKMTGNHVFYGVNFDGVNQKQSLMQSNSGRIKNCKFINCGFFRWKVGLGSAKYVSTLSLFNCIISSNYIGIMNIIDSSVINSIINANHKDGVRLMKGANNNTFIGVRNEWNSETNYYSSGGSQNIITGELIDRAGKNGVVACNGGSWVISGVVVKRSGRNANPDSFDNAHFFIDGSKSSILLSGVKTLTGRDDDGTGNLTPQHTLIIGNDGAAKVIVGSSDLTGSVSTHIIGLDRVKEKSISESVDY